ncbi:methyltransferase [Nonomuraea sp. NPDC049684]|uniref:methyltransferase n=1 Tax=unclassified Nonomuraea TaxID=2593643 RepID=UPI0037B7C8E3
MSCKPRVTYSTPSSPPRPSPSPRRPPPPPDDPPGPVEAGRPASVRLRTSANCSAWGSVGRKLEASPGVHRPSTFSAFLASTLDDTRDQVVLDAGCGAGLITLAALTAGARHVIAQDHDGAALADTARNVIPFLGHEARKRLTLWEADWRLLAPMSADLLAVNPPQRPTTGPHHRVETCCGIGIWGRSCGSHRTVPQVAVLISSAAGMTRHHQTRQPRRGGHTTVVPGRVGRRWLVGGLVGHVTVRVRAPARVV